MNKLSQLCCLTLARCDSKQQYVESLTSSSNATGGGTGWVYTRISRMPCELEWQQGSLAMLVVFAQQAVISIITVQRDCMWTLHISDTTRVTRYACEHSSKREEA